jgi:hypothetical protein
MSNGVVDWLASVRNDPLAFVMGAFPWKTPGTILENAEGPDTWQRDILELVRLGLLDLNTAIKIAVASGHGIGKSCLVAWLIMWAFMTFPDTRGRVTAGTEAQLKTTTWAELGKWFNLCWFAAEHFNLTATALMSKDPTRERTWRIDMVPWSENNPEAFAGMHNQGKRIIYIFDEGSAIPDIIYETAEGALTDRDTQIIWCVFGNPTKNSGRFYEIFSAGPFSTGWKTRQIDSRTVAITNKADIAAKIATYGEDTDYIRIRVLGQFPKRGMLEFFNADDIDAAMTREVAVSKSDPLAIGVDVARFGANNSVIWPRKGRDARTFEREVYNGISTVALARKVFAAYERYRPDGIFIDGGGVGGGVVDNCRAMQLHVFDIQFGSKNDISTTAMATAGERYANKRAGMYGALRAWLATGALPPDPRLKRTMLAITYTFNNRDEIVLTPKEDIAEQNQDLILDDLDALALTFAMPLAPNLNAGGIHEAAPAVEFEYNPFDDKELAA